VVISKEELWWLFFSAVAIVLDVVVPFVFLREGGILGGAFSFWSFLTVVVIAGGWIYTNSWLDSSKRERGPRS